VITFEELAVSDFNPESFVAPSLMHHNFLSTNFERNFCYDKTRSVRQNEAPFNLQNESVIWKNNAKCGKTNKPYRNLVTKMLCSKFSKKLVEQYVDPF